MIPVTKPFLPEYEAYEKLLKGIWRRNWLTNNGPLVSEYELALKSYLNVEHLLFLGNGTIALQIAFKALGLKGKVITTPFSYVATTSSLVWEGLIPTFVDIDPLTLNIDPLKIEEAIDDDTSAILATHCFGNACAIDEIQAIADKYGLKVIYDAAHCFGTTYRGKSIFEFGDISTLSLHATKPIHSVEGGAVFTKDPELLKRMVFMRNFGHDGPENYEGVGINGKNSEFHAAMGLAVLEQADRILANRKESSNYYREKLGNHHFTFQQIENGCKQNDAYFPVIFPDEAILLKVIAELERARVFPRRYFYPSLNKLVYLNPVQMPHSDDISKRILCLPLYLDLQQEELNLITRVIIRSLRYQ